MKYNKLFYILAVGVTMSLTSCIEETFPESSTATADQVLESPNSLIAGLNGLKAAMSQGYLVYGDQVHESDMAYPAYMIAQTELLSDMYPEGSNSGYDWYRTYNTGSQVGQFDADGYFSYLPWRTFYMLVKDCNDVISFVDLETETDPEKLQTVGSAYAARAFNYFMLTVLFEPIENEYTDCSKVLGDNAPQTALTVCKITEKTTEEEAKNNPRITHQEMVEFMLSDLQTAEKCLAGNDTKDRSIPGLAATYAIMAKVYAWDEDYQNAAKYARLAIETSGAEPMKKSDWLDKNSAFTKACPGWMWYLEYSAESMGNLCNFVGWMSAEADWGYSSLTRPAINKILYDKMGKNDWRKGAWLDPNRKVTLSFYNNSYNELTVRDEKFIDEAPDYLALKFRCKSGDYKTYSVGGAIQLPVLRIEEMYLLEALAQGEVNGVTEGARLLDDFMVQHRDSKYACPATDIADFEQEVLAQMRIEFWGEGNAFPIAKRIGMNVLNNYEGTNAPSSIFMTNFKSYKPNWTLVIPTYETQSNQILEEQNNPDPSLCVEYPTPKGEWATKK